MDDSKVKSLVKALKILECFNSKNPELGVTQISNMLGLNKSNVCNIVSTFEQEGFLEQNTQTGKYRLGLKLLEFSYVINEGLGYQRLFHDIMQDVSKQLNVITYFAVYRDSKVFYLCNTYPPVEAYNYPYRSIMGESAPLYCTSLGKAMLAFMPQSEFEKNMKTERIAFTDKTITDESALREEIALTRSRGYSLDMEEHEFGLKCMGVPILKSDNTMYGAFSISSPTLDFSGENIDVYARVMKDAARVMKERI